MIPRRVALGQLAAAGVLAAARPVHGSSQDDGPAVDVGVITEPTGGHLGSFLRSLAIGRGVNRVAVADATGMTFAAAREALGDRLAGTFLDRDEMLRAIQPRFTIVTLEGHHTPDAVQAALEAGSHVTAEKPGCSRLADFERCAKLASEKNLHLTLPLATRVSQAIRKARELIQSGSLGRPFSATMDWIADHTRVKKPAHHASWLAKKEKAGGGKLIYHGIHYLDAIQYLVGQRIEQVTAICANVGRQPIEVEDAAVVSFRTSGGMVGTLNAGFYLDKGYQNQIRFWGSDGWFHLDLPTGKPLVWHSTSSTAGGVPSEPRLFEYNDEPGLYERFIQECVDAARGRGESPMTTPESLHLMRVIFGAYKSSDTGVTQRV